MNGWAGDTYCVIKYCLFCIPLWRRGTKKNWKQFWQWTSYKATYKKSIFANDNPPLSFCFDELLLFLDLRLGGSHAFSFIMKVTKFWIFCFFRSVKTKEHKSGRRVKKIPWKWNVKKYNRLINWAGSTLLKLRWPVLLAAASLELWLNHWIVRKFDCNFRSSIHQVHKARVTPERFKLSSPSFGMKELPVYGKDTFQPSFWAFSTALGSLRPTINWTVTVVWSQSLTTTRTLDTFSAGESLVQLGTLCQRLLMSFERESSLKTTAEATPAWQRFV